MTAPTATPLTEPWSAATHRAADLTSGHTVRRYDQELARLRGLILEMGARVIDQTQAAVDALVDQAEHQAYRVLDREPQIDYLALDADEEIFKLIVRRQPTAVDLRIVLALSKIADDVERAGDKAVRIARQALAIEESGATPETLTDEARIALRTLHERAGRMFGQGVEAIAGFDVDLALGIFEDETGLYAASETARTLLSEQTGLIPRQIVCFLTAAHALERIGNHAANVAEQVIYVAIGQDVRFRNREILIETLRHRRAG